ncbi:hypothetical protein LPW26_12720 [Rhodopseudomonas sp. HC1]|uniref:hypothetical protein n=1 Tax=Rhodopseudomonas infernalis TaxID=2897386 RepID=UPI001EE983FD|nr:hypothetical protein [Rhodopseudomonas infernalis]MCG6205507.1 hypothetical protein [Rhodopseudomonas infernalis]
MEMTGRREAERSRAEDGSRQAVTEASVHHAEQYDSHVQDLQQENESLRELIVSLSELVIKRVAERR